MTENKNMVNYSQNLKCQTVKSECIIEISLLMMPFKKVSDCASGGAGGRWGVA